MIDRARRARLNPRISVVIPAKNEARNLEIVLPELPDVYEVILVDGHSVDDTIDVAQRLMPGIRVVHQARKGKGNALVTGFEAATGDIIVMFDADGSADPKEIPAFVEALRAGADFAKGSRFCAGGGSHDITRFRAFGNRGLNLLTNVLLKTHYTDLCYGYNAFWADILGELDLPNPVIEAKKSGMIWGDGFEIETVLNCRVVAARLEMVEVPSVERSRVFGLSNLNSIRDGIRVLKTILAEKASSQRLSKEIQEIKHIESVVPALESQIPTAPVGLLPRRSFSVKLPIATDIEPAEESA